jgi:hypothetical protein
VSNTLRRGSRVTRLLTENPHMCYVLTVKASEKGGNGTVMHTITVENNLGTKAEDNVRVILASDGSLHETTQWQCAVCECFTMCLCDDHMVSGD